MVVDYKKAALTGAAVGLVASFFMGRKSRRLDFGKLATYAGLGAGAVVAGSVVLSEVGRPVAMFTRTGHEGWGHHPIGHEHFHRW